MTDFSMTIFINALPERVWDAITGEDGNRAVMFGSALRGTLAAGSGYEFVGPGDRGEETVHVYGEVLEATPNSVLSLSEHPGPGYRENHAELSSRMTWRLEPYGETATKLSFTNDQWSEGNPSADEGDATWPLVLSNWKSWVESGTVIPTVWEA